MFIFVWICVDMCHLEKGGAIESKGQSSFNVAFYSRGVWPRESTVSEGASDN